MVCLWLLPLCAINWGSEHVHKSSIFGGIIAVLLGSAAVAYLSLRNDEVAVTQDADATVASALVPLEQQLGRPFVFVLDGAKPADFDQAVAAIDAPVGALDTQARPRNLLETDVYVMVRDNWTVLQNIQNHDLADVIRAQSMGKSAENAMTWFTPSLRNADGTENNVLVILVNASGLQGFNSFCFALTIYEMARFARNGVAFREATTGPGTYWRQCNALGWTSADDVPQDG